MSECHAGQFKPKDKSRRVSLVLADEGKHLKLMTQYLQNSSL